MKKLILLLAVGFFLVGCSYSSQYLRGAPMPLEQYDAIVQCLADSTIHRGMSQQEVFDILGPAQERFLNTWTYMSGRVNYATGSAQGDRWQFNWKQGKLQSVFFTPAGSFFFRRILKEDQSK